jgi:iron-sulfur cluster assembly accessory protein
MHDVAVTLGAPRALLEALLDEGIEIGHDCGGVLACASCRVVIRQGEQSLNPPSEDELDMLDRAGVASPGARLACQATGSGDLVVEIPRREAPAQATALGVSATPAAAAHLARQLARERGAVAVRLAIEPSGCSGFGYRVDAAQAVREGDIVFDVGAVRIVVDARSLPYVQGTVIDLATEGLARRLRFSNPNARQSCGCGESFGV